MEQNDSVKPQLSEGYPLFPLRLLLSWDLVWCRGKERPSVLLQGLWCGQHQHMNLILTLICFPQEPWKRLFELIRISRQGSLLLLHILRVRDLNVSNSIGIKHWCATCPTVFVPQEHLGTTTSKISFFFRECTFAAISRPHDIKTGVFLVSNPCYFIDQRCPKK